jgi:cytidine deaminase
MTVPTQELTPEDLELIEFARRIVDANTDGKDGIHTMGAAVSATSGTKEYDPVIFDALPDSQ